MKTISSPSFAFAAIVSVFAMAISSYVPFLSHIVKDIPIISLCLGQAALVFLFVLLVFQKAGFQEIVKLSISYLIFMCVCFTVMSFLPFESFNKLFVVENIEDSIPKLVSVNLLSLLSLNLAAFLFLIFGFKTVETTDARIPDLAQPPQNYVQDLRNEVNTLFDIYLQDYQSGNADKDENLENIENILLNNLDLSIEAALCLDKNGNGLKDTVFHWDDLPRENLLSVFNRHNTFSNELNTGDLCQLLIQENSNWYILAKYRSSYLVLKSKSEDPGPLLETTYKVFKSLH